MKKVAFLVLFTTLFCAGTEAQINAFNQRGKATQEMKDSGLKLAHPNLPNNALVKVTNTANGKEVEATVVNRIPASRDRIADLSKGVWDALELNPNTDIILSITPPPRQRVVAGPVSQPQPAETASPAKTPAEPQTEPPAEQAKAQSAPASPSRGTGPASNDDYLTRMREMLLEGLYLSILKDMTNEKSHETREIASPSGPTVITVYPPYPSQSVINSQPVVTDQAAATAPGVPSNTVYPQTTGAPYVSVPQQNQGQSQQFALSVPAQQFAPSAPAPQTAPPVTAPIQPRGQASRAAPQAEPDCPVNPAPQPVTLRIIPGLPNPDGNERYRLQVGAFCDPATADALEDRLKAAGFNTDREYYGTLRRVLVTGIPASQVRNTARRLEVMGIKQIWVRR